MLLTQDRSAPLIDSLTGHYNNTGTHSYSLWSASLTSVPVHYNNTGMHSSSLWSATSVLQESFVI